MKRAYRKRSYPLDRIRRFLEPGPILLVSSAWQGSFDIWVPQLVGSYTIGPVRRQGQRLRSQRA
jgi:hypothetical protein